MASEHLAMLYALEQYSNIVDEIEDEQRNDSLLARLEYNEAVHALHDRQTLDITSLEDSVCKTLFRFTYVELVAVSRALGFPQLVVFRGDSRQAFSLDRCLALAIMLRRLAYPSRLVDLELLFNINYSTIGVVFNHMLELLYHNYGNGIRFNEKHLNRMNLIRFADATRRKGK